MTRQRLHHRCRECGAGHPKWSGQCSSCGEWNSLEESLVDEVPTVGRAFARAQPIDEVDGRSSTPRSTGIDELDRVLGGGLVGGSVTLLGGEPGIGKSTLLLQMLAAGTTRALYVTAEESAAQVRLRAERLGAQSRPELFLLAETSIDGIVASIDEVGPELVVVDSIQTVHDPGSGSAPGTVTQVRECALRLIAEAKRRGVPVVLVGHVTKEGSLAGPRVLEHLVDTVLAFDGDRHHALRLVRATKHRFGPTGELGLFEMAGEGLVGVPDPGQLFLGDRRPGVPGSAITPAMEGQRPLLIEVQALTTPAPPNVPARRTTQGVDHNRLALLLAVLGQRAGVPTPQHDVYASTVGGVRLVEPGVDLALCLAVASAITGVPVPADLVAFGEVGLGGELRQVPHAPRRLAEAARLGFTRAVTPASAPDHAGLDIQRATSLPEALAASGVLGATDPKG